MVTIHNEVLIRRPVEEVFDYVANFENMPKWNYYVTSVVRTTPGDLGLGAAFHQVRRHDAQDYRIVEFEPSRVVTMTTLPPERELTMRFSLSPAGEGIRLVDDWTIKAGPWENSCTNSRSDASDRYAARPFDDHVARARRVRLRA